MCQLCAGSARAIDSIEISAARATLDEYEVSDLNTRIRLEHNGRVRFDGDGHLFNRKSEFHGQLHKGLWQFSTSVQSSAQSFLNDYQALLPMAKDWSLSGDIDLELVLNGTLLAIDKFQVRYQLKTEDLGGEIAEYALAFEGLDTRVNGLLTAGNPGFHGNISVQYQQGLLAVNDLLLEPVKGTLNLSSGFSLERGRLRLQALSLTDPGGLIITVPSASLDINDPGASHQLSLNVKAEQLQHVYSVWLQPLMYGSLLGDLELEGGLSANISITDRRVNDVNLELENISMSDKAGRFSLYGFSGELTGTNQFAKGEVTFSWQNAEVYDLLLGATRTEFDINETALSVKEPFNIPIYDGELKVFQLSLEELTSDQPTVTFEGTLTPVSLASISSAFNWPPLGGTISGVIPSVRYDRAGLKVDGMLLARAFDGTFKIEHLQMSDLFGVLPQLSADFSVNQIDLEQLTRAFDFGKMEGKLSGYIAGLKMIGWQATEFDAFFFTPENDESRHVISQRAVDNITSLSGSDIGSILSRSYLKFFENFRYERLGIGCRLRNNICFMNGIEAATGSAYYIVKGGFLPPRLDIIGYSNEVDWQDLLGRLERVMSDNAPVIQ